VPAHNARLFTYHSPSQQEVFLCHDSEPKQFSFSETISIAATKEMNAEKTQSKNNESPIRAITQRLAFHLPLTQSTGGVFMP